MIRLRRLNRHYLTIYFVYLYRLDLLLIIGSQATEGIWHNETNYVQEAYEVGHRIKYASKPSMAEERINLAYMGRSSDDNCHEEMPSHE